MAKPLTATEEKLLKAAKDGDVTMLRILEWRPVNFNARDRKGNTALLLACENAVNKSDVVKSLAQRKDVNVNAQNLDGDTAFHKLALKGGALSVSALLDAHANPLIVNNQGKTAAHLYLVSGFHDGLFALLDSVYGRTKIPAQTDSDGNNLLHLAAMHAPELAADLVARGVAPNLRNHTGLLPEDLCGDEKVAQFLRSMRVVSDKASVSVAEHVQGEMEEPAADNQRTQDPEIFGNPNASDDGEHDMLANFAAKAREYLSSVTSKPPKAGL